MATISGVLGIDEQALNRFASGIYEVAHLKAFCGMVPVAHLGLGGLESIEYDISSTPSVLFDSSSPDGGPAASLELVLEEIRVVLHYAEGLVPTTLVGSLRAHADIASAPDGSLVPELKQVYFEIPGEGKLTDIVNAIAVPYAARLLHDQLLAPIKVPPLAYGQVHLASPRLITSDQRFLATTAVLPSTPDPAPLSAAWPDGRLFVATDFDLLNPLADSAVPSVKPVSGHWSKKIDFLVGQSTIKADYTATLKSLKLRPVPGQPHQVEGTAVLGTWAKCWAKNVATIQGTGTSEATVTGEVVFDDSEFGIRLTGLKPFSVKFDLPGGWFDKYLSNLVNIASVVLKDSISLQLRGMRPLTIGSLPSFPMKLMTTPLLIGVKEPQIHTLAVDGRTLLLASAVPEVRDGS